MGKFIYPAPCAPDYQKPLSIEDCLPQARLLVEKIGQQDRPHIVSAAPRLYVREGDRVLIVTVPDQDRYVREAVTQVLMEKGATKVTFVTPMDLVGKETETFSVEDGWREAQLLLEGKASGGTLDLITGLNLGEATRDYLDKHPEYTCVFLDVGGGNTERALGHHAGKFRGSWPFNNWEWFLSRGHVYPGELWDELEKKIVEPLSRASMVRITDPEGTYLEFSLSPLDAKRWHRYALLHGHLIMNPLYATAGENRERRGEAVVVPPVFPKLNGVLAGTANHCGFFPRIELYFENDRLVEVKGGGKYGDSIRAMMDRFKDTHWPGYPGKGYFWFCDTALCTSVWAFRRKSDLFNSQWLYPNLPERTRAGVFHLGFGNRYSHTGREFNEYARKNGLPRGHIHVHNYFATFEVKIRGSHYWHKIVDRGWITAMDDPEIQALAIKYGDYRELLNYDWIPPLPGINCDGDYHKDYAPDPIAYLKKRLAQGEPI